MSQSVHVPSALNYEVNSADTKIGKIVLTYDKTEKRLFMHLRLNSDFLSSNNRATVLKELGFQYQDDCHFYNRSGCFWRETARAPREAFHNDSVLDRWSEYQHQAFRKFSSDLEAIIDMTIKLRDLTPKGFVDVKPVTYSFEINPSLFTGASKPSWVEKYIPDGQRELKDKILGEIQTLNEDFIPFLALLHETGEELENAVLRFFQRLGLRTEKTEKGCPVDIKATDGVLEFAVEVTGIGKGVSHKDGKVTQAFVYAGDKSESEKIVLVANTFRDLDPEQRTEPSFSEQTVKLLAPLQVCMVTAVDVFELWKRLLSGTTTAAQIIAAIHSTCGVLTASNVSEGSGDVARAPSAIP